jgi:hypothetical protein
MEWVPRLPNYTALTPDRKRIEYVLHHNIDNASAFACWVLCDSHDEVRGGVGGYCIMSLLSLDFVADDVFLFILPEYRTLRNTNMLISAYKEWAISHNAKIVRASHSGGSFREGSKEQTLFDELLSRQGFKLVGKIYHLNIDGE